MHYISLFWLHVPEVTQGQKITFKKEINSHLMISHVFCCTMKIENIKMNYYVFCPQYKYKQLDNNY